MELKPRRELVKSEMNQLSVLLLGLNYVQTEPILIREEEFGNKINKSHKV